MAHRRHYNAFTVYTDLLFCLLGFTLLVLAALLHYVPKATQNGVKPDAQYIVTLKWGDTLDIDLDLWMRDPLGDVIFYKAHEVKNISLDRDSRGYLTNRQTMPDGTVINSGNEENIAIRAIIPGDYLIAVGYYAGPGSNETEGPPVNCGVVLQKINPVVTVVDGGTCHFDHVKQSVNVIAFHINGDGTVTILPVPPGDSLVKQHGGG